MERPSISMYLYLDIIPSYVRSFHTKGRKKNRNLLILTATISSFKRIVKEKVREIETNRKSKKKQIENNKTKQKSQCIIKTYS